MACRCVLSCAGCCCVCVPLVSIEACSVGVSGVSGVSEVCSVGVSGVSGVSEVSSVGVSVLS